MLDRGVVLAAPTPLPWAARHQQLPEIRGHVQRVTKVSGNNDQHLGELVDLASLPLAAKHRHAAWVE